MADAWINSEEGEDLRASGQSEEFDKAHAWTRGWQRATEALPKIGVASVDAGRKLPHDEAFCVSKTAPGALRVLPNFWAGIRYQRHPNLVPTVTAPYAHTQVRPDTLPAQL
jgi:hypothetical protein